MVEQTENYVYKSLNPKPFPLHHIHRISFYVTQFYDFCGTQCILTLKLTGDERTLKGNRRHSQLHKICNNNFIFSKAFFEYTVICSNFFCGTLC